MIVLLTVRKSIIRFFSVVTEITGDVQLPGGLKCVGLFKSHDRSIKGNEGANMSNISTIYLNYDITVILYIIGKLDIFPLMCAANKVWITELTLIHKNIRLVCNSHAQELTLILKIISPCDVEHIFMSLIKTIMAVMWRSRHTLSLVSQDILSDLL